MMIKANGVNLFYEQFGNGAPMIMLHGNGEDHQIFDKLSEKLRRDFTVYALDSRNHGQSEHTGCYDYSVMAQDVYAFIQELGLGQVNIVGFSDGAIISLVLAMEHPHTLRRMALLGVNLKPDDFTEESYQFIKQTFEETGDPLFKLMLEQPQIELDDVRKVQVPALLIAGEDDIYKPDTFEKLLDALPHAALKIMKGHEHHSYIIDQDILYPDLMAFFADQGLD